MPERKFIPKKLLLNNMLYLYEKKRRGGARNRIKNGNRRGVNEIWDFWNCAPWKVNFERAE
jgi:hypothetical protein